MNDIWTKSQLVIIELLKEQILALQEQVDYLSFELTKLTSTSPNLYGDDDYATPQVDDFPKFPGRKKLPDYDS